MSARPAWKPDQLVTTPCHDVDRLPMYGMYTWGDAFTPRQLVALTTFSDLVVEAREKVRRDAEKLQSWECKADRPLREEGAGPTAYAEAVSVYLVFAISKLANIGSSITSWMSDRGAFRETFARQAIPMVWDYAEANAFSESGGSLETVFGKIAQVLEFLPSVGGKASQLNATAISGLSPESSLPIPHTTTTSATRTCRTSSMFGCGGVFRPSIPIYSARCWFPRQRNWSQRLTAMEARARREAFFLNGMTQAMHAMAEHAHPGYPVTIYYAFKQSERGDDGVSSTGWETFLDAVMQAGFSLTGTWPMRTEGTGRLIGLGTNALASSIILVCRPRPSGCFVDYEERLSGDFTPGVATGVAASPAGQHCAGRPGAGEHRAGHGRLLALQPNPGKRRLAHEGADGPTVDQSDTG